MSAETIRKMMEEVQSGLRFLTVAEAGSRAWGFSSPDSDWDVRFVYAYENPDKYIQIGDPSDVLMWTSGEYDFHGWDIKKALRLAMKSNFSLYEWLWSPMSYLGSPEAETLTRYIADCYSFRDAAHHYRGMAWNPYKQHLAGTGEKTLKKFLYVVRPILCIRHMKTYGEFPPVLFDRLLEDAETDDLWKQNIRPRCRSRRGHQKTSRSFSRIGF